MTGRDGLGPESLIQDMGRVFGEGDALADQLQNFDVVVKDLLGFRLVVIADISAPVQDIAADYPKDFFQLRPRCWKPPKSCPSRPKPCRLKWRSS